jgi:hypothetical protein
MFNFIGLILTGVILLCGLVALARLIMPDKDTDE